MIVEIAAVHQVLADTAVDQIAVPIVLLSGEEMEIEARRRMNRQLCPTAAAMYRLDAAPIVDAVALLIAGAQRRHVLAVVKRAGEFHALARD